MFPEHVWMVVEVLLDGGGLHLSPDVSGLPFQVKPFKWTHRRPGRSTGFLTELVTDDECVELKTPKLLLLLGIVVIFNRNTKKDREKITL